MMRISHAHFRYHATGELPISDFALADFSTHAQIHRFAADMPFAAMATHLSTRVQAHGRRRARRSMIATRARRRAIDEKAAGETRQTARQYSSHSAHTTYASAPRRVAMLVLRPEGPGGDGLTAWFTPASAPKRRTMPLHATPLDNAPSPTFTGA